MVELESGLARIASEKWYSRLRFHRTFETSDAFDAVLGQTGVPDLGLLAEVLGVDVCVRLAQSQAAQEFRAWFWSTAAALVASGADLKRAICAEFHRMLGLDGRILQLPCDLKFRFIQQLGGDYVIGAPMVKSRLGESTRTDRGVVVLERQAAAHRRRRELDIQKFLGRQVVKNEKCPCGTGLEYRECCGS